MVVHATLEGTAMAVSRRTERAHYYRHLCPLSGV